MQPNSSLRRVGPGILVGGTAGIASAILTAAIGGSVFFQGNIVGDTAKNANPSFIAGVRAIVTPAVGTSSATGGNVKVSGGAKYNTIALATPFNSTASTRGLRTGSGAVWSARLDINSNGNAVGLDCALTKSLSTGTAGTLIFDNKSATGSYLYNTPFLMGPTDYIKCGTLGTPKANFSATLVLIMSDTDVGK